MPRRLALGRRLALLTGGVALAAAVLGPSTTRAQGTFPDRAITLVVPFPAGGSTDLIARPFAERM